jgi:hypothetical protein
LKRRILSPLQHEYSLLLFFARKKEIQKIPFICNVVFKPDRI